MAPDGDIWGKDYEGVASLNVPILLMGGSGDTTNVPELCSYPIFEHLTTASKTFVILNNADHMVFGNSCSTEPWLSDVGLSSICADAVWDSDRAHDLINHFVTAFLLATLKDNPDAATALAADQAVFPGIQYQTTGF
jgi:predicted dienelactone hydrolase